MPIDDPQRLVIDRSPPAHLDDAEIRAWAEHQRAFISSVMRDMGPEREAVASAVERVGATPVLFERLGGRDDGPQLAYLDGVRGSDIYFGILGDRYGVPDETGYSPTHREYNEAVHQGLRISVWNTTGDLDGHQRDFLDEIRVFHTTGDYSTPTELGEKVEARLRELAAQAHSPWCKVGEALFRASHFADTGSRLQIEALLRDDAVVAVLEGLRPDQWGRGGLPRVTCLGRSYLASVESVKVEMTAGRAKRVTVEAIRTGESAESYGGITYGQHGPDDLTEIGLRVALFGEENPLGSMSFAEVPDPIGPLRGLQLSDDVLPGVVEVLLVESLVGSGRAQRLPAVRLGPHHRGGRRILVEWLPPRRYTNEEPQVRSLDGRVQL